MDLELALKQLRHQREARFFLETPLPATVKIRVDSDQLHIICSSEQDFDQVLDNQKKFLYFVEETNLTIKLESGSENFEISAPTHVLQKAAREHPRTTTMNNGTTTPKETNSATLELAERILTDTRRVSVVSLESPIENIFFNDGVIALWPDQDPRKIDLRFCHARPNELRLLASLEFIPHQLDELITKPLRQQSRHEASYISMANPDKPVVYTSLFEAAEIQGIWRRITTTLNERPATDEEIRLFKMA